MSTDSNDEIILSDPWRIYFLKHDTELPHSSINNVTEQVAGLALNEPNASAEPKSAWGKHEKLTGEILNEAAQRASAETHTNICVYHPTQNHKPSQDKSGIRPDYIIAWSYNGVRGNTAVIDAKDYHNQLPRKEYTKICDNMRDTKATRGILVLGPDASIGDKLRADIEKDGKVDIVQMQADRANVVRDMTQHIGKLIDKNFVPNEKHWETYKSFVNSTEFSKERKPDPYGKNGTYTCNSTYHKFNHPRKEDGTIDERYEANRDRNKDASPDMRVVHNKSQQAQEEHLNEDGSDDMRSKEHREELVDESGHRLNVDGSLDKRCNENKVDVQPNPPSDGNNGETAENTDMRKAENRQDMVDDVGHHLNVDGSPDKRCAENQEDNNGPSSDDRQIDINQTVQDQTNEAVTAIPTKGDGTADMRFSESKEAVASGVIEPDERLTDTSTTTPANDNEGSLEGATSTDIPTKADGTADMRCTASQEAVASGEISRDEVLSGGSESSMSGTGESLSGMMDGAGGGGGGGGGGDGGGPCKSDGTPDMRYSANQ